MIKAKKIKTKSTNENNTITSNDKNNLSILYVIRECYFFIKYFAFHIFSFPNNILVNEIKFEKFDFLRLILGTCFLSIQLWICYYKNIFLSNPNLILLDFGNIFVTAIGSGLFILNITMLFINRYRAWNVLQVLTEIDKIVILIIY